MDENERPVKLTVELAHRPDDEVYVLHNNKVKKVIIEAVTLTIVTSDTDSDEPHADLYADELRYQTRLGWFREVYSTREDLLKSL